MKNFTDLSALPGHSIIIDGEAYVCPDVEVRDMQGSVRKVPADRILAVQWHGAHGHGSIEGYGAMEGFADKSQLAPFVSAWLRARAKAKADKVDALVRQQAQADQTIASGNAAATSLRADIAAEKDKNRVIVNTQMLNSIIVGIEKETWSRPTDAQILAASAELTNAEMEVNADA